MGLEEYESCSYPQRVSSLAGMMRIKKRIQGRIWMFTPNAVGGCGGQAIRSRSLELVSVILFGKIVCAYVMRDFE